MRLVSFIAVLSLGILYLAITLYALPPHLQTELTSPIREQIETKTECLVVPRDGKNASQLHQLETFLKTATATSQVSPVTTNDEIKGWIVDLTDVLLHELQRNEDIKFVGPTKFDDNVDDSMHNLSHPHTLSKRDPVYVAQTRAVPELRVCSTPPYSDWDCYESYVYDKKAGQGIYIYHIEDGLLPGFDKEFPGFRVEEPLKTERYNELGQNAQQPTAHSTCVASKALGKRFGAAKKATLVPVLTGERKRSSTVQGLKLAREDIISKGRQKKSIVLITKLGQTPATQASLNAPSTNRMKQALHRLMQISVPVVISAGNEALDEHGNLIRPNVDLIPPILAAPNFPLIVVGNADREGRIYPSSQRGDKVTLYACGASIRCAGCDRPVSGTSFSAPFVAGVLAVFMSRNSGPFYEAVRGAVGIEFVYKVRKFLVEDANWERQAGVRMLWNLVTEIDHIQLSPYW